MVVVEDRKSVVVSGIRATGRMHLGNYLGVLERLGGLSQDPEKQCFFFVADLHTLTTLKDAEKIAEHTPNIILDMLASGVNPETATIYLQSSAPMVTTLSWLLACLTPSGDLERMPTFKDKAAKHSDDVNSGLLFYPVLMAADILGPKAEFVPVGEDQKPHLELARELARRFNRLYGNYFPVPDDLTLEMITVPGLVAADPKGEFSKMGKSEDGKQTIYLSDTAEETAKKIARSPTDPARQRRTDAGSPDKCVVYHLHKLVSSGEQLAWARKGCMTADISCLECKECLSGNINARLQEFRKRREGFASQKGLITDILNHGAKVAQKVFEATTLEVMTRMGITDPSGM